MQETTSISTCEGQHQEAVQLFQAGNYKEAARILSEVLKSSATSEIWNDWATAQLMCHQTRLSEQGYRQALALDPANVSATGNLGVLLASTGRIAEALPLLERAAVASSGRERGALLRMIETCREKVSNQSKAKPGPAAGEEGSLGRQHAAEPECGCPRPSEQQVGFGVSNAIASSAQANPAKAGVYFQGHVYGGSGYAEEAWAVALGVSGRNIPLQLVPVGPTQDTKRLLPEASRGALEILQRRHVDLSQSVFFQFAVADAWDMDTCGRWCVVRTMFETDRLPDGVAERCNAMDEIWVPSRFNLETYSRAGVKASKLRLVTPGADTQLFSPHAIPLQIPRKRRFNFLSVFDWHQRKGYDALLRAYLREFKPDEDVALILKVSHGDNIQTDLPAEIACFVERVAGLKLEKAPPIILINGFIPQQEMPRLYAAADCFVLPTRGEGYCRPFFEALSCELPVIATGWSGQSDFLNNENSYLIDSVLVPVPVDVDLEVFAGHQWAEPDVEHLRQLMRHVFSHQEEACRHAARGRRDMVQQYDWSVVIPQWVAEFQRLLG